MRWSASYIPTLKEAPGDAEVISHKLLVRAGMIRKLTSGIYTYLPLGLRALNKIAAIVREEMNRAGACEILMPAVQPGDLWKESGRWEFYGKELLRFQDRGGRDYCLGPTHEEVVTDLVRGEVKSYRQLPLNLYQIQTKFRDEIRPRFGLMRGREFMMKDAYSFDRDMAGADKSYRRMFEAYMRIFRRLGLRFRAVEADTGSIGGKFSHEFMVLAETGEDTIAACESCEYAANVERAEVRAPAPAREECPAAVPVRTPGKHTVEEVAGFLGVSPKTIVKTLLFKVDGKPVAALVRGDRELNPIKLKNHLGAQEAEMATPEEVRAWTKAPVGFAGPAGLKGVRVIADNELAAVPDGGWTTGANRGDEHLLHVDLERDAGVEEYADLRLIEATDPCPRCGAPIVLTRGIEVGHVFKLGLKYSEALNAVFQDENGEEKPMVMGCYGIGVSRVLAAAIEQNSDRDGICFPPPIAPYQAVVVCLDPADEKVAAAAAAICAEMERSGVDVLLDDRAERPGVKFKDADLVGCPMRIVVGAKGVGRGVAEATDRRTKETAELPLGEFPQAFGAWKDGVYAGWGIGKE